MTRTKRQRPPRPIHPDPFEKRLRSSKKAIVALVVIEQLLAAGVALGYWGQVGPWPTVTAFVIAGAIAGTWIWGQAWMERYTRVAFFEHLSASGAVVSAVSAVTTAVSGNKDQPEIPAEGGI